MKTAVTSLLTAPAGTGKSYIVVHDLATIFLPDQAGRLYSNLPLGVVPESHSTPPRYEGETFAERIGEFVHARRAEVSSDSVVARIKAIPPDVLASWATGKDGPWEYFADANLTGARIVIDEAHNFIGSKHPKECKQKWQLFCGELRHRGASIQFVTQSPGKLAKEVIDEAGVRQALVNAEDERDPFFRITLGHWYELKAKLVGRYEACFCRLDMRDIDGKKNKRDHVTRITRRPEIFELYDSHSAPQGGGNAAGAEVHLREFQRRSWPSLIWWFIRVNKFNFVRPVGYATILICAVLFWKPLFQGFQARMSAVATKGSKQDAATAAVISQEDAGQVVEELKRATEANRALSLKLEEAETIIRRNSVVCAITPGTITFRDGRSYNAGQKIYGGPYDGREVKTIDLASRYAVLDGDERVYLGEPVQADPSAVGEPVPAKPIAGVAPVGQFEIRAAGYDFNSGATGSRSSAGDASQHGSFGDSSGGHRIPVGDDGRNQRTGGGFDSRPIAPAGDTANAYGKSVISR